MVQKHCGEGVIEALIGEGQREDVCLHDLQPRIVTQCCGGASGQRVTINAHNMHVEVIGRRPAKNCTGNVRRSRGKIDDVDPLSGLPIRAESFQMSDD